MELGCDSVQVICTAHLEGDMFARTALGKGNLYARYGAVRAWLDNQKNMDVAQEIGHCVRAEDQY